jgi:hypothetical protein
VPELRERIEARLEIRASERGSTAVLNYIKKLKFLFNERHISDSNRTRVLICVIKDN